MKNCYSSKPSLRTTAETTFQARVGSPTLTGKIPNARRYGIILCYHIILSHTRIHAIFNAIFYCKFTTFTILYYTMLYYIMPHHSIPYHATLQYTTILYFTVLYYTILYYTILYYTILYYRIHTTFFTILYHFVLHSQSCTKLWYTMLYYSILHEKSRYSI